MTATGRRRHRPECRRCANAPSVAPADIIGMTGASLKRVAAAARYGLEHVGANRGRIAFGEVEPA